MRRPVSTWRVVLVCLLVLSTGCVPTQPFYLHGDRDLSHYIDRATQAETPDVNLPPLADVAQSEQPLTLSHPDFKSFWDLTMQECVAITLANTKVLRGGGSGPRIQGGQLFANTVVDSVADGPRGLATIYNPAIVESNPGQADFSLFGQQTANGPSVDNGLLGNNPAREGVEAALADFDTQFSFGADSPGGFASSQDRPQNVNGAFTGFPQVLNTRNGGGVMSLSKRTAAGTQFFFRSTTDYNRGNNRGQFQALNSIWTQALEVEARHPLLRGAGTQINRMPIILARIGNDIEIAGLENQLQQTLDNLEFRYWDLYLQYRNLETAKVARDSALVTWRIVYDKFVNDVEPIQAEAQAREQYFNFRSAVESAMRQLYDAENELRFLMGISATDGRLIRPKDDPTLAQVEFDWCEILAEAIARRPELIQQRWLVKLREMELIQYRNRLLPQLDVGATYRWLGVGDNLIEADRNGIPFPQAGSTAWEELTGGKFQEWALNMSYSMPIGFRKELAGVRHGQLRLAREKAVLEDMELDVSHGLAKGIRNLDTSFHLSQTNANRWAAAQQDVEAREALYAGGRVALDDVLEAQRRRALAQSAFWQAVTQYNQAIADLHTRKGSIMEYDGIGFQEGPWPQKANWDAMGLARQRDAGWYIDYGWTRPKVISRGAAPQSAAEAGALPESKATTQAEELPSPEPTPAGSPRPAAEGGTLPEPKPVPLETRHAPRLQTVSPASATFDVSGGNPLRGNRPIGTGLAD